MEKTFVCHNLHTESVLIVRIPFKKIYISTISKVRMVSETVAVDRVLCLVRQTVSYDWGWGQDWWTRYVTFYRLQGLSTFTRAQPFAMPMNVFIYFEV